MSLPRETIDAIGLLYDQGVSIAEIHRQLGIGINTVRKYAHQHRRGCKAPDNWIVLKVGADSYMVTRLMSTRTYTKAEVNYKLMATDVDFSKPTRYDSLLFSSGS